MKYKIIQTSSICALEVQIEALLREGWQLQGGVSVVYDSYIIYAQALTKVDL